MVFAAELMAKIEAWFDWADVLTAGLHQVTDWTELETVPFNLVVESVAAALQGYPVIPSFPLTDGTRFYLQWLMIFLLEQMYMSAAQSARAFTLSEELRRSTRDHEFSSQLALLQMHLVEVHPQFCSLAHAPWGSEDILRRRCAAKPNREGALPEFLRLRVDNFMRRYIGLPRLQARSAG